MPKQVFESSFNNKNFDLKFLDVGYMALVTDGDYEGCVILRTYQGFVCIYSPNISIPAFHTTWETIEDVRGRLLEKNEKVILSNE